MDGIKIDVIGNVAKVIKKPSRITSGTVGLPIEYTFDEQWDGLTKVAVFRGGAIEKSVDLVADLVVPWEVLLVPGVWLSVGVYGANEDGSVAIPTIWANVLPISVGVDPEGDPSADPTLPIWADVLRRIANVYTELDKYDPTYAVRYIAQALSEQQQMQARMNIDAVGSQYLEMVRKNLEDATQRNADDIVEMKVDIDAFKGVENGLSGDTPSLTLRYDKSSGQLTYGVSYTNDSNPETTAIEVWDNTHAGGLPENIPPILCEGEGEYKGMLVYSVKDPLQQDGMTRKLINFKINRNLNKSVLRFKIRYNTVALPDGTVVKPKLFVSDEWISPNVFGADYAVIDEIGNPVGNPMLGLELYKWYTVYVTANGDADFQMWPVWNDIDELLIEAVIKDVELLHHETMPAYIRANSGTCGPMSLYKSPDGTWEYTYSSFKAEGSTNNTAYYRRLSMKLDSSDYVEARFDFMYTKSDYRGTTNCNFASDVPVTVVDAQGNVVPAANRQLNTWYTAIFKKADGTNLPKSFDMYPQGHADGTSVGELNIEMQIKNCRAYRLLTTIQTDTTLSKAGVAADAKATGDALAKLKPDSTLLKSGVPADAKATGEAIGKVRIDLDKIADYPVETGTEESTDYTGTWYWEKWKSGKAVCWGAFSIGDVAATTAWGDLYESTGYSKTLPDGLFVAAPDNVDLTVSKSDSAMYVTRFDGTDVYITKDNIGRFTFSRPTSRTVRGVYIGVHAIGRWK